MSNYFVFIVKNVTIDDIIINVMMLVKNNLNKQIICVGLYYKRLWHRFLFF